jgi:cell division protein FtsA
VSGTLSAVVDFGTSKVAALVVERRPDGSTKVLAGAVEPSAGVSRGVVSDADAASAALESAVGEVEHRTERRAEELHVSIGGSHVRGGDARGVLPIYPQGRDVRREDLLSVVQHSRQSMLPPGREHVFAVPRYFRLDGGAPVADPVGLPASRLEVTTHAVTADAAAMNAVDHAVRLGGRRVAGMVPTGPAAGLGAASRSAMEQGCVVVDLGAGTTSIAVFAEQSLAFTACLPLGAEHVTTDVAALLGLGRDEAERVKREHGVALAHLTGEKEAVQVRQEGTSDSRPVQRRVLCEVIESRLRETAGLVRQLLEPTGLLGSLPGGLWLTGGGSLLPGTEELFSEALALGAAGPRPTGQGAPSPTMSVAIGLAKFALAETETDLAPVSGQASWRERVRTIRALLQPRQQESRK